VVDEGPVVRPRAVDARPGWSTDLYIAIGEHLKVFGPQRTATEDGGGNGVKIVKTSDTACQTIKVEMKTLDSFGFTNIGFIKVDVEGFETEVLKGGLDTLRINGWPPILFESWGDWRAPEGINVKQLRDELFDFIKSLGYSIVQVSGINDTFLASYPK